MVGVYHVGLLSSGRKAGAVLVYYPSGRGSWYSFSFNLFWIIENYIKENYIMTILSRWKFCRSGNNCGHRLCRLAQVRMEHLTGIHHQLGENYLSNKET